MYVQSNWQLYNRPQSIAGTTKLFVTLAYNWLSG